MFTHHDIWSAIDRLADRHQLSASGLAKKAGLSSTLFNPSKRKGEDRNRWPSTESIAAILKATHTSIEEFAVLVNPKAVRGEMIPILSLSDASKGGVFNKDGCPTGEKWDTTPLPAGCDAGAFMIEITGPSLTPVYNDGERIVVSPQEKIRRGDRVVVLTRSGDLHVCRLGREGAHKVELIPFRQDTPPLTLSRHEVLWIYRIIWVSQ